MNDKERLKIILDNSIYDHNFEEFTVPLKDMDWLIQQAERVDELEEEQKLFRKQVEGFQKHMVQQRDKISKSLEENQQAMTRVHQLVPIAIDQEQEYKDLWEEKQLVEEECERYKKMFSKEKGKNIELEVKIRSLRLQIGREIT